MPVAVSIAVADSIAAVETVMAVAIAVSVRLPVAGGQVRVMTESVFDIRDKAGLLDFAIHRVL